MQTFIEANAVGTELDLAGINEKTLKAAKKFFGASTDDISLTVDLTHPGNAFWFRSADADRAMELLAGENLGPIVPARKIKDNKVERKGDLQNDRNERALSEAGDNARRVRHPKMGDGTVIADDAKAVTVLFDGAKKPARVAAIFLETI